MSAKTGNSPPAQAAATPVAEDQRPLLGVVLVLAAVFIFACMDSTTKHLATL